MGAERVSLIEDVDEPDLTKSLPSANPLPLRIAQRAERDRVQRLMELTHSLLREVETLVREKAFAEELNKLESINLVCSIDFYSEVEKFETGLIKLALKQTGGNQARASKLLHIKPTTLNSKIKLFGIDCSA